ncbi:MAG: hypothetical protein IJC66_03055 [Kiritimatiellae bacterium]|nr:hypothetical protein [Kiritimatiellia bacterium]
MLKTLYAGLFFFLLMAMAVHGDSTERIYRIPRFTRGNTSVFPVQPIDQAAWITHPVLAYANGPVKAPSIVRFRCTFTSDGAPLVFDVTGDERYLLTLDGSFVSRGPHRGTVDNWMYQSYRAILEPGVHVLEATVWKLPPFQFPHAQHSYRHGFCLKAEGPYDAVLTTGRGKWTCGLLPDNVKSIGKSGGVWGTGDGFEIYGTGSHEAEPTEWTDPAVVRKPLLDGNAYGLRQEGWMLYPSQLRDQMSDRVRPGRFVDGEEMSFPIMVRPGEKKRILWDLDRYICAYPEAVVKGGKGGKMTWRWAESLRGQALDSKAKGNRFKGNRNEWRGKTFDGFGDRFVFDGRDRAVFQPPWFRCGRWCEIVVEAGDEPVEIQDLSLLETRYPLECESRFKGVGDPAIDDVQAICVRAMQMCCHEMLFDCPYYEQQMYPGDTRIQLNVISAMTADDAMIRRAIEIFDLNRRDDGIVPFNFPTVCPQDGAAYTLCYLGMYSDYVMNHTNRDWLRARLPGFRNTLSAFELYERADGLLENIPGWSFLDWVPGWKNGWAPGSQGGGANAELNLFYIHALQGAVRVEDAFGNRHLAAHWREKANRLKKAVVNTFFNERRGLFASDAAHTVFAEHAQCLALLTDVFEPTRAKALFERLITEKDMDRTTVYFSYYLFETYFKFGRADLFLKRLDLWKGYVKLGATTTLESPEFPDTYTRSDCHAWGAHPIWFLRTGVAGIRSAAPFFERVRITPQPGGLNKVYATYPHPSGKMVEVDLVFEDGSVRGRVTTPVAGEFIYGNLMLPLSSGVNVVR